jgi:tetratricopeptide (TPR) repeat protein
MNWRFHIAHALACMLMLFLVSLPVYYPERNNSGVQLYLQGDFEGAIRAFEAAEVNAPNQAAPYFNAASALAEVGRLRAAEAALQQALLRSDDETLVQQAYFNLGNIYFELALYEDAILAYREVLVRDPANEAARHNYELALSKRQATPTPTMQEQNTNPEQDQTDPEAQPTSNPADQQNDSEPTPTPTNPVSPLNEEQPTLVDDLGGTPGPLDATAEAGSMGMSPLEEIERQLDAIQDNQRSLREFLNDLSTPGPFNERDW